ncbi:protein PIN-LIKES 7-like [Wolffia australiana]
MRRIRLSSIVIRGCRISVQFSRVIAQSFLSSSKEGIMGFWDLLVVASEPVVQVMLIGLVGAFLAVGSHAILSADALKHMNKVVYVVFTPSLIFASLAKTITLGDIISWWFMPVNIGLTFVIGGALGWLVVKLVKPEPHLRGLIIAVCSAANLGNLMVIVAPAICSDNSGSFGETTRCHSRALSYSSFSMALGGIYIWTHTYSLMKNSGKIRIKMLEYGDLKDDAQEKQNDMEAPLLLPSTSSAAIDGSQKLPEDDAPQNFFERAKESTLQIAEELMSPPTAGVIMGFVFGATPWLKTLIIGPSAPLRSVFDAISLMGNATIPSITIILGGNLAKGLRKSRLNLSTIIAVMIVKLILLPAMGLVVTEVAVRLGLLPKDPLFRYILLLQYTNPAAMAIGTMAELFDVAREECSVLLLWNYLLSALALTLWTSFYIWFLS